VIRMVKNHLKWNVFFASAALLLYEIALMRLLDITSFHHFAFAIVSAALLGFGASGTLLYIAERKFVRHSENTLFCTTLVGALSIPIGVAIAQFVPVRALFLPALFLNQLTNFLLYGLFLSLPFFLLGLVIGLTFMISKTEFARMYAFNLTGSALGTLLAPLLLNLFTLSTVFYCAFALTLVGLLPLPFFGHKPRPLWRKALFCGAPFFVGIVAMAFPLTLRTDPLKFGAYVQTLKSEGRVEQIAQKESSRGHIQIFKGQGLQFLPFFRGQNTAPHNVMLIDGNLAGPVFQKAKSGEALKLELTLMGFAYALAPKNPNVLILDEQSGYNIAVASRFSPNTITITQKNPDVVALLPHVFADAKHSIGQARAFIENTTRYFDVIHIADIQAAAAGSAGFGGLLEHHLLTIEGIATAIERLTPDGILVATRGIQEPPRDNLKLLALFDAALKSGGVKTPSHHMMMVRDFLGASLVVKKTPFRQSQIAMARKLIAKAQLTPIWFKGIRPNERNHPDAFPKAPDFEGDIYSFAAQALFAGNMNFFTTWPYDIAPNTDDRPFYYDFFKWRGLDQLKQHFGDTWLTRLELGYLFVVATLLFSLLAAGVTIFVPTLLRTQIIRKTLIPIAFYFFLIGIGYLGVEIIFLSVFARTLESPVLAASLVFGGFLLFSGLGSMTAYRLKNAKRPYLYLVITALIASCVGVFWGTPFIMHMVAEMGAVFRYGTLLLLIAPMGYCMGFPMPLGIAKLTKHVPQHIAFAYATNGFASVIAAPLALLLAMSFGFSIALFCALTCYFFAVLTISLCAISR